MAQAADRHNQGSLSSMPAHGTATLALRGISKRFGAKPAIDNVSLQLEGNEYVSLLGPSGSGKTVLLRLIAGFERPDAGEVWLGGELVSGLPAHRRGIGFVFQNFALFPNYTVFDNIAFGLKNGSARGDAATRRDRVKAMVALVGLEGLEGRAVHQISGGQRQRVALARTLVTAPRLVLLDEPLGALDANLRARMRGELRRIREQLGTTFLHVTGSESEALSMGDRVVMLDAGRIAQIDRPQTVYHHPAGPNVARFLNCYNMFEGVIDGGAFRASAAAFPIAGRVVPAPAPHYAIRHDLVQIRPAAAPFLGGEAVVEATFLASEYAGAVVINLFALPGGGVVEVESHLSQRRPEPLDVGRGYTLAWRAADAIVFG